MWCRYDKEACRRQGRGLVNSRPAGVTPSKTLPQNKTKTVENNATKEEKLIKNPPTQSQTNTIITVGDCSILYIVVQTRHVQLSGAVLPDTQEDLIDVIFFSLEMKVISVVLRNLNKTSWNM